MIGGAGRACGARDRADRNRGSGDSGKENALHGLSPPKKASDKKPIRRSQTGHIKSLTETSFWPARIFAPFDDPKPSQDVLNGASSVDRPKEVIVRMQALVLSFGQPVP
jgi:hypothetical protein